MRQVTSISEAKNRQTTILCIDDDEQALDQRTSELEAGGYRVLAARTGSEAVKVFVDEEIDLILSALVFPGVSGAELSIFMRQVRPEVSVVLLSRTARIPAALMKQVDGYIEKNAATMELLTCVEEVLARRTGKQQRRA